MSLPEPFGGLLLLAAMAALFVAGVVVAIVGRRSKRIVCIGIGIIAAPWVMLVLLAVASPGIDEWNPSLESDATAWGIWEGDGYWIDLNADSTYEAKLKNESTHGTWRRNDWNVYLKETNGQERYMRFVEESGDILLLPDPPRDDFVHPGPITTKR